MSRPASTILALTLATAAAACTPHYVEVRQGNYLTDEVVDQVETGMSREQVRYLLGTPVAATPFRADRWDYVYSRKRHKAADEYAYLVVWFDDDDSVERFEVKTPPSAP